MAVHGAGVVHRDLKPSNVIVGDDGPVLIDFGIAQAADDSRLTAEGLVIGTPGYLAPELLDGDEPDAGSDFWGWAAILAFAATGRDPFGTRPLEAVLARARSGDVDLEGLGPLTTATLSRALAPAAGDRIAPEDVVAALTLVAAEGESIADETATAVLVADDLVGTTVLATEQPTVAHAGRGRSLRPGGRERRPDARVRPDRGRRRRREDAWDEDPDGVEWINEDLDASEEPEPEGSGYERPRARRRWGTLLAAGRPARLGRRALPGRDARRLHASSSSSCAPWGPRSRRCTAGASGSASSARTGAVALATGPWHLLRSVVGLLPSLVVGASVVVILLGVSWWLDRRRSLGRRRLAVRPGAPGPDGLDPGRVDRPARRRAWSGGVRCRS